MNEFIHHYTGFYTEWGNWYFLGPQVFKAALETIISCQVEESWGIVLMRKSHLQGRHRQQYMNSSSHQSIQTGQIPSSTYREQLCGNCFWHAEVCKPHLQVWWNCLVFTTFRLHIWVSEFTGVWSLHTYSIVVPLKLFTLSWGCGPVTMQYRRLIPSQ